MGGNGPIGVRLGGFMIVDWLGLYVKQVKGWLKVKISYFYEVEVLCSLRWR